MIKTALLLIIALIVIPVVAIRFDAPLSDLQWQMISFSFQLMLTVALLCFAVSELTRNYSQVDKIWSITPVGSPVCLRHSATSSTWLSWVTSIAMTRMPYLPASSKTHGRHSFPWPWNEYGFVRGLYAPTRVQT